MAFQDKITQLAAFVLWTVIAAVLIVVGVTMAHYLVDVTSGV